jgi:hypothetical protein
MVQKIKTVVVLIRGDPGVRADRTGEHDGRASGCRAHDNRRAGSLSSCSEGSIYLTRVLDFAARCGMGLRRLLHRNSGVPQGLAMVVGAGTGL